jgi:hypothetical protein
MAAALTVSIEATRADDGTLDYKATLTYLDKDGNNQTVELDGHEPLIIINMVNDAMRNSAIDLTRGAPPPVEKKEEEPVSA